ncbi:oligosaccharide flippase family protein [Alteromonas sp. 009811495]|uniref:oligosaccharide flippase family protein n=1 Tax=Alteromonas sp. 009811495 TaxID=3002962 RepID=UPI00237E43ED|nr:oligosaccharide flippase family protein [Alteromonas sp. 009811495]WDT85020.1 oligosaccharide flippase family protein [Alteromonas sp. 009811495]
MRSAFLWSFASNYLEVIIRIVSVVVLARLLTPTEIGTFAIAGAIFAVAQMFRDMGLSSYLIKEEQLTDEKKSGALFVSWFICISLSFIIYCSSDSIGKYYSNAEIGEILNIFCINLLLIPIGILEQSQIRRNLDFKRLACVTVFSQTVHLTIAIYLAYDGFGALSLAYASLSATITTIIMVKLLAPNRRFYFPKFQYAKQVLPFVFRVGGANILNSSNEQGQPIIVGKLLTEEAVAILDKGTAAIMMLDHFLFNAIKRVLVPLFSKLKREKKNVQGTYLEIVCVVTCIAWPFLVYLGYHAELVVLVLFGEQWVDAIVLIPYLCVAFAIATISRYVNELLTSTGLEVQLLRTSVVTTVARLVTLILVAPYGLEAIAMSLILVELFRFIVTSFYLNKHLNIGPSDFIRSCSKSMAVMMICILPIVPLHVFSWDAGSLLVVSLHSLFVAVFWFTALKVTEHPLLKMLLSLMPKKSS